MVADKGENGTTMSRMVHTGTERAMINDNPPLARSHAILDNGLKPGQGLIDVILHELQEE